MSEYLAGRAQMGTSLAFHIVFASLGVGLPLLLLIVEGLAYRRKDETWRLLARRWSKAFGILFAIGAVSGTVLSFELGLLWPGFMKYAGSVIGLPFSLEGFAFFTEAIFLGLYLYGWDRLSPLAHWLCTIPLAVSGAASAWFVTTANSWMNSPTGFKLQDGVVSDVRPIEAIFNPGTPIETAHTMISAYVATGFAVAAVYAVGLLRGRRGLIYRRALTVGMLMGIVATPLQIITGDINARWVADYQPAKLAAMEGQFQTEKGAPLRIGGIPNPGAGRTDFAIEIPAGLSFLAYGDPGAVVKGLQDFPAGTTPNPVMVHISFQLMVAIGFGLLALSAWFLGAWIAARRQSKSGRRVFPGAVTVHSRALLLAIGAAGFAGFAAVELGWMVTELGRQPWVIYGVVRTSQAITPAPGLVWSFVISTAIYVGLAVALVGLLLRLAAGTRGGGEAEIAAEEAA
ncbi:MAG TPA: cytochrome ubiquinol oxidase subunit I [Candidatus Dormibacteraeota bacterium]|nr:cytochrome ubiquinol oxidase subunit I [Candidatus Dormibacteraeota bacterium]